MVPDNRPNQEYLPNRLLHPHNRRNHTLPQMVRRLPQHRRIRLQRHSVSSVTPTMPLQRLISITSQRRLLLPHRHRLLPRHPRDPDHSRLSPEHALSPRLRALPGPGPFRLVPQLPDLQHHHRVLQRRLLRSKRCLVQLVLC